MKLSANDLILSLKNVMIILCHKQDLNLGPSRIAVFKDCKATALTAQPPRLDQNLKVNELPPASFQCKKIFLLIYCFGTFLINSCSSAQLVAGRH